MSSKDDPIHELEQVAQSMVQGTLSESTRQCGDPACACAHDPGSRHGPHLYFRYSAQGKVHSVLADRDLVQIVYEALAQRCPKSRTRGRPGTPAEVVLRLLLLKHMRNWSYHVLEREVRANLVYRQFTRVGAEKVPDAKTLGKLGVALGPEIIEKLHQRVVAIAQDKKIIQGRKLRVDTTVVETD